MNRKTFERKWNAFKEVCQDSWNRLSSKFGSKTKEQTHKNYKHKKNKNKH